MIASVLLLTSGFLARINDKPFEARWYYGKAGWCLVVVLTGESLGNACADKTHSFALQTGHHACEELFI